ncbi:hypothetical protein H4R20_004290 [Coemansia guatemalensis]|uniref:Uncharacterized protein n=1 Tax=Coemansia guatemalensis TaxID=2761395 RepID=A0A9W8HWF5_9FUNG|nr:hypothetical protein H4R20_004290 [Coemansia guatemalensis]
MTDFDSTKRQRTNDGSAKDAYSAGPSQSPTAVAAAELREALPMTVAAATSTADSVAAAAVAVKTAVAAGDDSATRDLLERLLVSQERLTSDVAQLQATVESMLGVMHEALPEYRDYLHMHTVYNQQLPAASIAAAEQRSLGGRVHSPSRKLGAVPPTLANIVSPHSQAYETPPPNAAPARCINAEVHSRRSPLVSQSVTSESPKSQFQHIGERARAASSGDPALNIVDRSSSSMARLSLQRHRMPEHHAGAQGPTGYPYAASPSSNPASGGGSGPQGPLLSPTTLPPPAGMLQHTAAQGHSASRMRSPVTMSTSSQSLAYQQQQQPQAHVYPLPAPLSASSALPPVRHLSTHHHGEYRQGIQHQLPRIAHPAHSQYNPLALPASPRRMHQHQAHAEQPVSLPPIMYPPAAARLHEGEQYPRNPGTQQAAAGTSSYAPAPSFTPSMGVDSAPSKPSPSHGYAALSQQTYTGPSTPGSGGMAETPTRPGAGVSGSRSHHYATTPTTGRSFSAMSGGAQATTSQQKVEKNRFQANIRSFVDQYFAIDSNMHWDYQQSFKAPRNAEATRQIAEAFHTAHGGSFERIEHGLSVYFSSLKAKNRTTVDKAMLKQQRDRRRARRIKKAAGRRKVFDPTQYPFLPPDINAQLCFVPMAMSPEHTDDDSEVKVGTLPWRSDIFTRLFHHLDTLRPKRTPRPTHPRLSGGSIPAPDVPEFMIDPAFVAVDRAPHDPALEKDPSVDYDQDPADRHIDPEEDVEMGSSDDDGV